MSREGLNDEQLRAKAARREAVRLKLEKYPNYEICEKLDISPATLSKWLKEEMAVWYPADDAEDLRQQDAATLDWLENNARRTIVSMMEVNKIRHDWAAKKIQIIDENGVQLYPDLVYPPAEFIKVQAHMLDIQKRRSALFGLDAPAKLMHTVKVRNQFDEEIEQLVLELAGGGLLLTSPDQLDVPDEAQS